MSFWTNLGTNLSQLQNTLTALGVSAANMPTALNQIGSLIDPNAAAQQAACATILKAAGNVPLETAALNQLEMSTGLPTAAFNIAVEIGKNLATPGYDIVAKVLEIETIIKNGG